MLLAVSVSVYLPTLGSASTGEVDCLSPIWEGKLGQCFCPHDAAQITAQVLRRGEGFHPPAGACGKSFGENPPSLHFRKAPLTR